MELKDFKVGQTWATREGQYCQIEAITDDAFFPVRDSQGRTYTLEGQRYLAIETSLHDLVELIQDAGENVSKTPETKSDHASDVDERLRNALIAKIAQAESRAKEAREAADELAQRLLNTAATNDNLARDLRAVLDSLSKPL